MSGKPLVRFELWIRVQCPDKECGQWTFLPSRERPKLLLCTVCSKGIRVERLEKEGLEFQRRGVNKNGQDAA